LVSLLLLQLLSLLQLLLLLPQLLLLLRRLPLLLLLRIEKGGDRDEDEKHYIPS